MKISILFIFTVFIGCSIVLGSAFSQEDMIVVNTDAFKNPQRPPAIFRHDEHNETAEIEECNECHHVYDDNGNLLDDESSEDQRCADCHNLETSGRKPALMKAFHKNCKGCHKEKKQGPIMCGQCHVRRLASVE